MEFTSSVSSNTPSHTVIFPKECSQHPSKTPLRPLRAIAQLISRIWHFFFPCCVPNGAQTSHLPTESSSPQIEQLFRTQRQHINENVKETLNTNNIEFPSQLSHPVFTADQFKSDTKLFFFRQRWEGAPGLGLQRSQCITFPITLTNYVQPGETNSAQEAHNNPFTILHVREIDSKNNPQKIFYLIQCVLENLRRDDSITHSVWPPLGMSSLSQYQGNYDNEVKRFAEILLNALYLSSCDFRKQSYLCLPHLTDPTDGETKYYEAIKNEYNHNIEKYHFVHIVEGIDATTYAQKLANDECVFPYLIMASQEILGGLWFSSPIPGRRKTEEERAYQLSTSLALHGYVINDLARNKCTLENGLKALMACCVPLDRPPPHVINNSFDRPVVKIMPSHCSK